jgi:hypothetical protein
MQQLGSKEGKKRHTAAGGETGSVAELPLRWRAPSLHAPQRVPEHYLCAYRLRTQVGHSAIQIDYASF